MESFSYIFAYSNFSMKQVFTLTFLLLTSIGALAQSPGRTMPSGSGSLTGTVIDSATQKPIEFATVYLLNLRDSSVYGSVTDPNGRFTVEDLGYGMYKMEVGFIGFNDVVNRKVMINPKNPDVNLGAVLLHPSTELIDQVEIVGEKRLIEVSLDKKTYNVEKDITAASGSALDVLDNVPSVEVESDNTITLRGSSNVRILIDGRPAEYVGDVATFLQGLPGTSIETIDIITNPSAKYDPEGMSGILNIKMKKSKKAGINGTVSINGSVPLGYGGSLNLNYRTPWMNLYANGNYRYRTALQEGFSNFHYTFPDSNYYRDQNNSDDDVKESWGTKAGVDFYLNKHNTIGFSYSSFRWGNWEDGVQNNNIFDMNRLFLNDLSYTRYSTDSGAHQGETYGAYYRIDFLDKDHELTFDYNYSNFDGFNYGDYANDFLSGVNPELQETESISKNRSMRGSIDYTYPDDNGGRFEMGYLFEMQEKDQDFYSISYDHTISDWVDDVNLNNIFEYTEVIHAGYGTYAKQINKKWGYLVGMRLEQAKTISELVNEGSRFENPYVSVFPSAHLSYAINKFRTLQLSYSKRINRPNPHSLNPFTSYQDPYNLRTGNPFLKPEYVHSFELGYSDFFKKGSVITQLYYRRTNDLIRRYKTIDSTGVSSVTWFNFNTSDNYGFEFISSYKISKWWSVSGSFDFFQTVINGDNVEAELQSNGFSWRGRLNNNFTIAKNLTAELSGRYRAPFTIPQGEINNIFHADAGIRWSILDKKGNVSLSVRDMFNTRKFSGYIETDELYQEFERQWRPRSFSLAFTYSFGKQDIGERRRRNGMNGTEGLPDIDL